MNEKEYLNDENKTNSINIFKNYKYHFIFILGLIILIFGVFKSIDFYKDYTIKQEVKKYITEINNEKSIFESVSIEIDDKKVNYSFSYNDNTKVSEIILSSDNISNQFVFDNNQWYVKIPDYYQTETNNYSYIKINQEDVNKDIMNINELLTHINWLKNLNKGLSFYILDKNSRYNIHKKSENEFEIIWKPKDIDFEDLVKNSLKENNIENEKEIIKNLANHLAKWSEKNEIKDVLINIYEKTIEINIYYNNHNNKEKSVKYLFTTSKSNTIKVEEYEILDIKEIVTKNKN